MQMSAYDRAVVLLGGTGMMRVPRPALVSWFAVLLAVRGGIDLVMLAVFPGPLGMLSVMIGVSPQYVAVSLLLLGGLGMAAGVGMWRGARWGWWLAAFYFAFAIYRYTNAVGMASGMADPLPGAAPSIDYDYRKHVLRVVFNTGLLYYWFQDDVLAYFGLRRMQRAQALGWLALPIAFMVAAQLVSLL